MWGHRGVFLCVWSSDKQFQLTAAFLLEKWLFSAVACRECCYWQTCACWGVNESRRDLVDGSWEPFARLCCIIKNRSPLEQAPVSSLLSAAIFGPLIGFYFLLCVRVCVCVIESCMLLLFFFWKKHTLHSSLSMYVSGSVFNVFSCVCFLSCF